MSRRPALIAGCVYFSIVFAAGFALGVPRTLWIAPAIGELRAVLLEVPVMLAIAWVACDRVLRRIDVGPGRASRLLMGGAALVLLLAAEAALAVLVSGQTLAEHVMGYARPAALVGGAAQVASACFPLVRACRTVGPSTSPRGAQRQGR